MATNDALPGHWPLGFRLILDWHRVFGWTHSYELLPSGLIVHRLDKGPGRRRVYLTRDRTVDRGLSWTDTRGWLRVAPGGTLDLFEAFRADPHGVRLLGDFVADLEAGRVFYTLDGTTFSVRLDDVPEIARIVRQ